MSNYSKMLGDEIRTQLRPVRVQKICPHCREGVLKVGNLVLTTDPPQYPHTCTNPECGRETVLFKAYPCIGYEEDPE